MKVTDIQTPVPAEALQDMEQLSLFEDPDFIERAKSPSLLFKMEVQMDGRTNKAWIQARVCDWETGEDWSWSDLQTSAPLTDHTIKVIVRSFAQGLVNTNASLLPF